MGRLNLGNMAGYPMESFSQMLKGAVYKSHLRSAILYGSEAWCLEEKGDWKLVKER